jgi:hypothetical protein
MEIKGRQCEEVKIGKDKLYFITDWKGKEVMEVMNIMFGDTMLGKGSTDIDAGVLIVNIPKLFPIFCVSIKSGDKEIEPSTKYLEELSAADYLKVQNQIGLDTRKMLEGTEKKA